MNADDKQRARVKTVMRNTTVSVIGKIALIIAGFAMQRAMADALGQASMGLNSVFLNVISILSLAELGISNAIVYHLYAPLARGDSAGAAALMRLYAKCYNIIALAVGACGLAVLPFVHVFLRDSEFPLSYVRLIFCLYLAKAVLSYFFSYRRSLLIADQKVYVVSSIETAVQILSSAVGIAILYITKNFAAYLVSAIVFTVAGNAAVFMRSGKLYPYLAKPAPKLPDEAKKEVFATVRSVFVMRLSGVVLTSTDSLIISSFISTIAAGVYNSYAQIIAALNMLIWSVKEAVQPTLGALFLSEDKATLRETLSGYTFVFFLGASFAGVSLLCLATPFVTGIWLTPEYGLEFSVVAILALNFFITTLRVPLWSMLEVSGLFAKNRDTSLVGALMNIAISLALVGPMGMLGVFAGTFISQLSQVILKARVLFKYSFGLSPRGFAAELLSYFLIFTVEAALGYYLCSLTGGGIPGFCVKLAVCAALPFGLNALMFFRTKRFKAIRAFAVQLRGRRASS